MFVELHKTDSSPRPNSLGKSMGKCPKKKQNSEYYAVTRGFYLNVPTIFSSW